MVFVLVILWPYAFCHLIVGKQVFPTVGGSHWATPHVDSALTPLLTDPRSLPLFKQILKINTCTVLDPQLGVCGC